MAGREAGKRGCRRVSATSGYHISILVGLESAKDFVRSGIRCTARSLGVHFHAAKCGANHEQQCAASDRHDRFDESSHKSNFANIQLSISWSD